MGERVFTSVLMVIAFLTATVSPGISMASGEVSVGSRILQVKAGNHILGFAPDKAYLASLDHALSVQFLGTKGVMPKSDTTAPATGAMTKALPLGKVLYQNLWDGISLTYESTKAGITESTYHLAPGADVSRIRLRYNVPVEMQKDGSLQFKFNTGNLTESAPIAWQEIGGKRKPVDVAFGIHDGTIGFQVGNYDRAQPLIIDPTYKWHTFYGSSGYHAAQGMVTDGSGNVYVTGYSANSWNGPADQPPLNTFSVGGGNVNIFVLKLDSSGAYQWHVFYGSGSGEIAQGIAIDNSGNVYVTGESPSNWNGPPPSNTAPLHAWSSAPGCVNLFVLKLDNNGAYQWHTFYGPPGNGDNCTGNIGVRGVTTDGSGNVYVTGDEALTGWTGPSGQAPLNPFDGNYTYNPFVLKLAGDGAYVWHTFNGYHNNGGDTANAIAVDGSGSVYVTGTSSTNWNGPGACTTPGVSPCSLNAFSGTTDIFVFKLNSSGTYQWHTFLGSGQWNGNGAYGMALDNSGHVYVTGWSEANWNGPGECSTPGVSPCPLNAFSDYSDIFVLKLNSSGTYQWHTFYGANGSNGSVLARGIAINGSDDVYVTGMSWATWNGPGNTPPLNADGDFVVLKLNSSGAYQWHTFYGPGGNYVCGMAIHGNTDVYVTGLSESSWNGPAPANTAPLHAYGGGSNYNLFVLKLNDSIGTVVPMVTTAAISDITSTTASGGGNVTSEGGGPVTARGVCWATSADPTIAGSHISNGSGTGSFTSAITGLSPYTFYHVRAYASNSAGTAYGNNVSFNTLCPGYVARTGTTPYDTLQGAVNAVVGTVEIRAVAGVRSEELNISGSRTVTLLGGYDCVCGAVTGITTVHGSITIGGSAVVTMNNIAVY